jgi:UDP-N-acetylmuramate dehydrogenase
MVILIRNVLVIRIRHIFEKINITGPVTFDEPLSAHTSFGVGGPCGAYVTPSDETDVAKVFGAALEDNIPLFVLGGGANILVADRGIPGIVLDMAGFSDWSREGDNLTFGAGMEMSRAAEIASGEELAGLAFLYAMPGSVGGSLWMNARCYGKSVSDVVRSAYIIDAPAREEPLSARWISLDPVQFAYKKSPFQDKKNIILKASFELAPGEKKTLLDEMREHREDRDSKGHFSAPSAGSVFKNNREFGMPSGKIIDSLGLRGYAVGGARVSDLHANIIINTGTATAWDIRNLIEYVQGQVKERLGLDLEREILFTGDWG